MKRLLPYSLVAIAIAIPSALVAAVAGGGDDDDVESIVKAIERDGLGPVIEHGAFDTSGLEVSAGTELHRFDGSERQAARELLDELTGIDRARSVRLRQQQVTVHDGSATAVLNVELDGRSWVALRLAMVNQDGQWRVERVRVMS